MANDDSYSYAPTQADVVTYKALTTAPCAEKYVHLARWYKHIASFEAEFATLPGDASKAHTEYGPEPAAEVEAVAEEKKEEAVEEEEEDLFGSDEEEDPAETARRSQALADYRAKKEAKPKPISKTLVSLEVKAWGEFWSCNDDAVLVVARLLILTLFLFR